MGTTAKGSSKKKTILANDLSECQAIFDSEKDLIMVLDTKLIIKKANRATSRFLKKPLNRIVGKTCYRLIHGIDRPPGGCPLDMIIKSKKHEEAECYLSEKDIWLRVLSDPIFDRTGRMRRIVLIIRDITDFRRTEALLRESERRFKTVFDYANHGIHVMDMVENKTLMANRTLCEMLCYSNEEFKNLRLDDIYPQEALPPVVEQLKKLLRDEIDIAKKVALVRKDGSVLYADVSAAPFMFGGKTYVMGIFRHTA
ncbi:MAG: PAS domain-containing protein [Nitrospirota bacterium]